MSQKLDGRYCATCEKKTMALGTKPNHILHFILTLLTGGLWGIMWIFVTLSKAGNYRCSKCGSRV